MAADKPLKSAYELAMERLRAKDRQAGVDEARPLDASQKRKIAKLRRVAEAKLAELKTLHRGNVESVAGDPEKLARIEDHHRIDCRRIETRLESAIAGVKQGGAD